MILISCRKDFSNSRRFADRNEIRNYPTRYPHIVIERIDHFRAGASQPDSVQWSARRVQNQRTSTQINRMLDAANLGVDLVRFILH